MNFQTIADWENIFSSELRLRLDSEDPAHDYLHFSRVSKVAKQLCVEEGADLFVVVPAAWLHDLVNIPKSHPQRHWASRMSAEAALELLRSIQFPSQYLESIRHAIEAHSFSAGIKPESLEAKIVQDADRLDALGAIGLARVFTVGAALKRPIYNNIDPFCTSREPNDQEVTLDHFYTKLFRLPSFMQTESGRKEAHRRVEVMKSFLKNLELEIS